MGLDPIKLTKALVECATVTPKETGCIDLLETSLTEANFNCTRINRGGVSNLYARWGTKNNKKCFGFNGHVDVVPAGDILKWKYDPFKAVQEGNIIYGRGTVDMKSAVSAFTSAAIDYTSTQSPDGAVVIMISGDEEGPAADGTVAILDWMQERQEKITYCLVGEPTCPNKFGEMIKIGRRGSITTHLTVVGKQGHVAYPNLTINPINALIELLQILQNSELDKGTEHFDPSKLTITTVDAANETSNVVPNQTKSTINIRFNDSHSGNSLKTWIFEKSQLIARKTGTKIHVSTVISAEPFTTPPGYLSTLVSNSIAQVTGVTPTLSTSGGTSDARFIINHCPVIEFGLVGDKMHATNEAVNIEDILKLKSVYYTILKNYFEKSD
jgi:succinyl-diaminopimelate desuccinylase